MFLPLTRIFSSPKKKDRKRSRVLPLLSVRICFRALNATLMAEAIAEQLKKRASYRRAMKSQCENAMNAGAKGVKIICGGRLGGAEIARSETQKLGSIPLQTLDANVDYGVATSHTTYGTVGIKVWIYKGKFGEEITPVARPRRQQRPRRGGPGGPGGRGGPGGGRGGAGGGGGRGGAGGGGGGRGFLGT